jgi:hypothetical protein
MLGGFAFRPTLRGFAPWPTFGGLAFRPTLGDFTLFVPDKQDIVGGMTPGRVKRLERYKSYGRLYAGLSRKGLAGI